MKAIDPLVRFLHKNGLLESIPDSSELVTGGKGILAHLASKGLVDEDLAIRFISQKLAIDFINLEDDRVLETVDVGDFKPVIEASFCRHHRFVPIRKTPAGILVACANPLNLDSLQAIEFTLSSSIKPMIAKESAILEIVERYWTSSLNEALKEAGAEDYGEIELIRGGGKKDDQDEEFNAQDVAPIVKLVNEILVDAISVSASDIHIEPTKSVVDVRFRIDGTMQKVIEIPKRLQPYLTSRIKILATMDVSERRRPQDGRLGVKMGTNSVDMRVSTIPTSFGEKIVLRILRNDYDKLAFIDLGLPQGLEFKLRQLLTSHSKLLLVTGPTGSGKTTTLYTAINQIRDGKKNITTVEDPIEYKFEGVNQIQLNKAIDVTFGSALRSILRQDPDVIMIGEIRDQETINIALQSALTGHLVLSTLHTNDAPNAITRINNLGADPFVVSQTLAGILAQRLIRKVCANCAQVATDAELEPYKDYVSAYKVDPATVKRAVGCDRCFQTGYKGRIGIYSYLEVDQDISRMITQGAAIDDIVIAARQNGYQSLDEAAANKLRQGLTTFDEIKGYLSLDAKVRRDVSLQWQPSSQSKSATTVTSQQTKVLLVDDSPHVRKLLRAVLEKEKFQVVEAENGQVGLDRVKDAMPDIVLCDLSMNIMDGEEFLRRIKQGMDTKTIPVIMLTGDATEENETKCLEMGASDFVSKKSSPAVLVRRIRKAITGGVQI